MRQGNISMKRKNAISRRGILITGGAAAALTGLRVSPARAVLRLDVTQGNVQPVPIAVPDFLPATPGDAEPARNVTQIITANLARSGLFAPIDQAAYIEKIADIDVPPRFPDWRAIGAQALATGRITRQSDGRVKTDFRLWDVFAGSHLTGQ